MSDAATVESPAPLFKIPIPIIVLTGKNTSGKTLFGLTICNDPSKVCHYDNELSGTSYNLPGLERVPVPEIMRSRYKGGYKPIDLWQWWLADMRTRLVPGKFRVAVIDPASELETGVMDWTKANPGHFGATPGQYEKMSAIAIGHAKAYWKQILAEMASRVECLVIIVHMGKEWSDNKPTGRLKPKGLETLHELASLYLELRRDVQPNGEIPKKPEARVIKSRLAHMVYDRETGNWEPEPILPPRIPEATPAAIRAFIDKPLDYKKLKKEFLAPEDKVSEEEMAQIKLETARAEADAARDKLILADRVLAARNAQAVQAVAATQRSAVALAEATAVLSQQVETVRDVAKVVEQAVGGDSPNQSQEAIQDSPADAPATDAVSDAPVAPGKLLRSVAASIHAFKGKLMRDYGMKEENWKASLAKRGVAEVEELEQDAGLELLAAVQQQLAKKQKENLPVGNSKS